jgi:hypothetical protein
MIKVESPKSVRRFQKPDWLDYAAAPDLWAPATLQDLLDDAEREKQAARTSIEAVETFISHVTAPPQS